MDIDGHNGHTTGPASGASAMPATLLAACKICGGVSWRKSWRNQFKHWLFHNMLNQNESDIATDTIYDWHIFIYIWDISWRHEVVFTWCDFDKSTSQKNHSLRSLCFRLRPQRLDTKKTWKMSKTCWRISCCLVFPRMSFGFFERTAMEQNPTCPTCRIMPCWARYCTAPGEPAQQLPLLLLEPQWSLSAEDSPKMQWFGESFGWLRKCWYVEDLMRARFWLVSPIRHRFGTLDLHSRAWWVEDCFSIG